MLFKSPLLAQASGSVAGNTFSRNKGGMYIRSRSLVITPKTPAQQGSQNAVKTLSSRWATLTAAQRAAWRTYAQNVPMLNKLGESRVIPEMSQYIRANSPRLQSLGATGIVDAGPTTFALAVLTTPTLAIANPSAVTITFSNTDAWAVTTGGHLLIQISKPVAATRIFPKARFVLAAHIDGLTATPPTSPFTFTSPYVYVVGQQVWIRVRATNSDGRASSPQLISCIVA